MRFSLLLLLVLAAALGCQRLSSRESEPLEDGTLPNPELVGQVSIDGSSTVYPISEAAAAEFQRRYPKVGVTVGQSGTGGGFKRFTRGETGVSDASRPIKREEFEAARSAGVEFIEVPVAYDGLTIVVHPENDWVDALTVDELRKIFTTDTAAQTWSQIRPEWPDIEVAIFAPGTDSGTFDYFNEVVAGDDGELRSDMSTSEDDNVLVTGVSGSPGAIGFFGVAYYEENRDHLRAVPVVNPELGQPVFPTAETIESGEYAPFSRPLFIYVNAESLRRPEMKLFTRYYLENAPRLAASTGYVSLPPSIYERAMENVRERNTGTHYLTAEGESRSGPVTEVYTEANRTSF